MAIFFILALYVFFALTVLASLILRVYGIYLSFKKAWYMGAVALFVPLFAEIVGIAKLFFKKDLLE